MLAIDSARPQWESKSMSRNLFSKGLASRTLLRVLLSLALLMTAFAHRPAVATPAFDAAAYVLPDGSLPVLCLPSGGKTDGSVSSGACEFCRLASSVVLPEPPADPDRLPSHAAWRPRPLPEAAAGRSSEFPAAPPQGPPALA